MNLIFDLDDTLYNLMGPFELVHKKLYADKTDADCTQLFMQSRVYSDEIMEAEKKGLIPHEDCFYERVERTDHGVGIEMSREDADIFEQLYRSFQKKITLGNGVEGFLDYCKSNDIFIAILTNGRPEPQYAKVVALGLHKWFDDEHIFISGGIGYQKPDPQAYASAYKGCVSAPAPPFCNPHLHTAGPARLLSPFLPMEARQSVR